MDLYFRQADYEHLLNQSRQRLLYLSDRSSDISVEIFDTLDGMFAEELRDVVAVYLYGLYPSISNFEAARSKADKLRWSGVSLLHKDLYLHQHLQNGYTRLKDEGPITWLSESEAKYLDVEKLLNSVSTSKKVELTRDRVSETISKAEELIQHCPNDPDFHHMLGLDWYRHPGKSGERSQSIRKALKTATDLNPSHQFANQYLGYINFDEGQFEQALAHFRSNHHDFFISIEQKWRSLKTIELAFVCELYLARSVDLAALKHFFEDYLAEEQEDMPDTVFPIELLRCAEWLFDRDRDVTREPLRSILQFLNATGELEHSDCPELRSAQSN